MRNPIKLLTSAAVAAVFLSASPASAQQGTPAYGTTFYSDASKTTQIGSLFWSGCYNDDTPQYDLIGRSSRYSTDEHIGYCSGGSMQPL